MNLRRQDGARRATPVRLGLVLWLAVAGAVASGSAWSAIAVVTTTADLQSLVEAVGGPQVNVVSLAPPGSDAEDYAPRPQDLDRLRTARLVVRVGIDYDLWLDRLLQRVGRPELQRGGSALVDASAGIVLLGVKGGGLAADSGVGGHAHGVGNPHYWLDPANADAITGQILLALAKLDPPHAKDYEQRRTDFLARLDKRLRGWQARLAPLAGRPLLVYHDHWPYFARRFGLSLVGTIEPRPGVAPSPAALAGLMRRMREEGVGLIVRHPQDPTRDADFLAAKTGARVAVLAASVGDLPGAGDYLSLFDTNIAALLAAAGAGPP